MMAATIARADQLDLTASFTLLRPSAEAAEALALAEESAEDAEEEPREREIEASLEAEEREDLTEAEDTIFKIEGGSWNAVGNTS